MVLDGRAFYVEMDMGTMAHKAMLKKWRCYAGVSDFLLVVCLNEARKRGLIQRAQAVSGIALFATLDDLADPHAETWEVFFGNRVAISMPKKDAD